MRTAVTKGKSTWLSSSPARTTTRLVPSPTSTSCEGLMEAAVRAAVRRLGRSAGGDGAAEGRR